MNTKNKLFNLYPEFVEDDTRKDRKLGYKISAQFLDNRYAALLPPHIIQDNTILDLGAAIGSAGAWCLHHGAKHYTGVDSHFSDIANKNFNKYFDPIKWQWVKMNVEEYLERSGGMTLNADKKRIYIVRADGSVSMPSGSGFFRNADNSEIQPGDTLVVPLDVTKMKPLTVWSEVTQVIYQLAIATAAVNSF